MQFGDVSGLFGPQNSVWILSLGPGHGQAVLMVEVPLARTLLSGALGDRSARTDPSADDNRHELTNVERRVLRSLLGIFCEALADRLVRGAALSPRGAAQRIGSTHGDDLLAQRSDDPVRLRGHRRRDRPRPAGDPLRDRRADQEVADRAAAREPADRLALRDRLGARPAQRQGRRARRDGAREDELLEAAGAQGGRPA